jgi:hypothetical protein
MSELLARLRAGRAAVATATLGGVAFGLRVLTEQDYLEAGFATDAAMKAAGVELSVATADLFEDEKASQLLARALVDPGTSQPVAASARDLRQALTRDDRTWLAERYLEHEKQFSPSQRTLSDAELSDLVEEVKKTPATPRLNDSSTATLKRLITALVLPHAP